MHDRAARSRRQRGRPTRPRRTHGEPRSTARSISGSGVAAGLGDDRLVGGVLDGEGRVALHPPAGHVRPGWDRSTSPRGTPVPRSRASFYIPVDAWSTACQNTSLAVDDGAAEVRRRVARHTDRRFAALALAGPAGELQVALEHLGHPVHPAVAERPATGERGQRRRVVAVDAAVAARSGGPRRPGRTRAPRATTRRTARTRRRAAAGRRRRARRRRADHSRRAVSAPTSMMSSSGQCSGSRWRVGCPLAYPATYTGRFGRSRARSAVVSTKQATPSTGMSQSRRQTGSAISGASR